MILFINTFLTQDKFPNGPFTSTYQRGRLQPFGKIDIFKYMLSSLKIVSWSKVIIYCDVDEPLQHRQKELFDYIKETFPGCSLYNKRNGTQAQWQNAMQEVMEVKSTNLVWFCCNDDHIFMDRDLNIINEFRNRHNDTKEAVSLYFSHWPELLKIASSHPTKLDNTFIKFEWQNIDSIQLLSKKILYHWWFKEDYGVNTFMGRSDWVRGIHCRSIPTTYHLPFKEIVRHFDGYGHVGIDLNKCPPLEIPSGFFDKKVILEYGGERQLDNSFYINPTKEFNVNNPSGTQAKWGFEDVPRFWLDHISETIVHEPPSPEHRDKAILDLATSMHNIPYIEEIKKAYGFTT